MFSRPILPILATFLLATVPSIHADALPTPNQGTLQLVTESGKNRFAIGLSVPLYHSDSAISVLTGTITARLDIDPTTGRSPEFTILDGDLSGTGISLRLESVIPFGVADITATSSGFGATTFTSIPPGTINPLNGQGDASQHEIVINEGTVTGYALGQEISANFATDPASGSGVGTSTVTITPTGTDSTRGYFQVTFVLPVNISKPLENDLGLDVSMSATGTLKATGSVSVPLSDYLAWTETQGIPGADPDAIANGISNGLTWALGLGLTDNPFPHLPQPDPAMPRGFALNLPASGSGGLIYIETTTSLSPAIWELVDPTELSFPSNPLPAGTNGTIIVDPTADLTRFLRIRAQP